jgi:hypothetical protein
MDNYIRWNISNWITVVLMVYIATTAFGFASQAIRTAMGKQ